MADGRNEQHRNDERTLAELHRMSTTPPPQSTFARSLRDELMSMPTEHSTNAYRRLLASVFSFPAQMLRHPGFASVALLVFVLVGAYLAVLRNDDGPRQSTPSAIVAAAPTVDASPVADSGLPTDCTTDDLYFGCPDFAQPAGAMHNLPDDLDETSLDANQVQLQGWAIAPGARIARSQPVAASGLVVDFILTGTYVATFDVPVSIYRGMLTNDNRAENLAAGSIVELGRGDSISYQLGGMVEIYNPLETQRIEFKRAVIYTGDISNLSVSGEGVTTNVEADGLLPRPLGDSENGYSVELWYVWVNSTFPPRTWANSTVIGPVDPQFAPQGVDGFVLVINDASRG